MSSETSLAIGMICGASTALTLGFAVPALQEPQRVYTPQEVRYFSEQSYCRETLRYVNCVCFARRTTEILAFEPRIQIGPADTVAPEALARSQAARRCSQIG